MPTLFNDDRIEKIAQVIKSSITKTQHNFRKQTAQRLVKYIDTCSTDEEFYAKAWNDFPVWCAAFINDDSDKPLFPSIWQAEYAELMATKKYVWAMCSRKVGKSTLLAVKNLHDMCGFTPKRIVCFAPTMKQDYVFDKMNKYLRNSPYLNEVFIGSKGSLTKMEIELQNSSTCQNKTIGLQNKGELVRGEYGDTVTVDEIQKIEEAVMRQIIFPILADAYSEKKMRMLGTPNLFSNPHLQRDWLSWVRDSEKPGSEYGYMNVDWKRGVMEGCLDENYVIGERGRMTPDEFAMEYEGKFPEQGSRFYDNMLLNDCVRGDLLFKETPEPEFLYCMAVDWATFVNRTQILIGEYNRAKKTLRYVYWKEVDPKVNRIDYENQVGIVKELFHNYRCEWICPDATSNQDALIRMLVSGDNPIPPGLMYTTGDRLGYCASDILNDQMWRNHRQQMVKKRIIVPRGGATEERFAEKWRREHNELSVKAIRGGNIIKLEEPRNGYKDLAVTCGMLSLFIQKFEGSNPYLGLITW